MGRPDTIKPKPTARDLCDLFGFGFCFNPSAEVSQGVNGARSKHLDKLQLGRKEKKGRAITAIAFHGVLQTSLPSSLP